MEIHSPEGGAVLETMGGDQRQRGTEVILLSEHVTGLPGPDGGN